MSTDRERTSRFSFVKIFSRDPVFGYLLIAPILIWMAATLVLPLFRAIQMSFFDIEFIGQEGEYIGLKNYAVLFGDADFTGSLLRTFFWTGANVVFQTCVAFGTALILDMNFKGRNFIRIWVLLPWVVPVIVLATIWRWMLDPSIGVVNYVLLSSGAISSRIPFIGSVQYAMITAILVNTWRWFPFYAVIILASLQTIPESIYQAAKIDGANILQQFRYITIPSIAPVLTTVILLCALWAANVFDILWLLTQGGPGNSTETLPLFMYQKGFQEYRLSQAATVAVLMFVLLLIFGIVYMRTLGKEQGSQQ